jgi:hypothetical protein
MFKSSPLSFSMFWFYMNSIFKRLKKTLFLANQILVIEKRIMLLFGYEFKKIKITFKTIYRKKYNCQRETYVVI